jgi:hypothetical protein
VQDRIEPPGAREQGTGPAELGDVKLHEVGRVCGNRNQNRVTISHLVVDEPRESEDRGSGRGEQGPGKLRQDDRRVNLPLVHGKADRANRKLKLWPARNLGVLLHRKSDRRLLLRIERGRGVGIGARAAAGPQVRVLPMVCQRRVVQVSLRRKAIQWGGSLVDQGRQQRSVASPLSAQMRLFDGGNRRPGGHRDRIERNASIPGLFERQRKGQRLGLGVAIGVGDR